MSQPGTPRDQATSVHFDRSPQFVPLAPVAFGPITTPYGTYGPAIPATPGVDDTAPKMFPRPTRTTQLRSQEYPTQRTCHRSSSSSKIGKGLQCMTQHIVVDMVRTRTRTGLLIDAARLTC